MSISGEEEIILNLGKMKRSIAKKHLRNAMRDSFKITRDAIQRRIAALYKDTEVVRGKRGKKLVAFFGGSEKARRKHAKQLKIKGSDYTPAGTLRKSVRVGVVPSGKSGSHRIIVNVYATSGNGQTHDAWYAHFLEFGTERGIKPGRFMSDSLSYTRQAVLDSTTKNLSEAIENDRESISR